MEIINKILSTFSPLTKYVLILEPRPKPRMVKSDSWKKRPIILKYWEYKDALRLESKNNDLKKLPPFIPMMIFFVAIPKTGRRKVVAGIDKNTKAKTVKIEENDPVFVRPDVDNYIKALLDCMETEDNYIHTLCSAKRYSKYPRIEIYLKKTV